MLGPSCEPGYWPSRRRWWRRGGLSCTSCCSPGPSGPQVLGSTCCNTLIFCECFYSVLHGCHLAARQGNCSTQTDRLGRRGTATVPSPHPLHTVQYRNIQICTHQIFLQTDKTGFCHPCVRIYRVLNVYFWMDFRGCSWVGRVARDGGQLCV